MIIEEFHQVSRYDDRVSVMIAYGVSFKFQFALIGYCLKSIASARIYYAVLNGNFSLSADLNRVCLFSGHGCAAGVPDFSVANLATSLSRIAYKNPPPTSFGLSYPFDHNRKALLT